MAEDSTDILMMVSPTANTPLETGRTIDVTSGDVDLLTGTDMPSSFTATTTCYLTAFGMSAGIDLHPVADEKDADEPDGEGGVQAAAGAPRGALSGKIPTASLRDTRTREAREREEREREGKKQAERDRREKLARENSTVPPGEPQPVEFERWMDAFSPILLDTLQKGQDLDSITIVKRKATGNMVDGVVTSGDAFLRLDFIGVLLVSLEWKADEAGLKETGKFVYRSLKVQYRPQNSSGTLAPSIRGTYTATVGGGTSSTGTR